MTTIATRKIVKIDEEKCNGCGICVPSCAEGAIQIIDGKAKLVSDKFCDGLGACLGECPLDAITIEERSADDFDEEAANAHVEAIEDAEKETPFACPSVEVTRLNTSPSVDVAEGETLSRPSMLGNWPVQLTLVPPTAPFLQGTDLVLAADCVPFTYPDFHQDFLEEHSLLIACPKLDDLQAHMKKLAEILKQSEVKSLTVVHMEVPCCSGLVYIAQQAIALSGKNIPLKDVTIGIDGKQQS